MRDFPTGKAEGIFELLHPFVLGDPTLRIEPFDEATITVAHCQDGPGVRDRSIHLQFVSDNSRISQKTRTVLFVIGGHLVDVEPVVGGAERVALLQDWKIPFLHPGH